MKDFARTHGEYFAYLGSDDLWLPDFLTRESLSSNRDRIPFLPYGHAYIVNEQNAIVDFHHRLGSLFGRDTRAMLLQTIAADESDGVVSPRRP